MPLKLALIGVVAVGTFWAVAAAVVPRITDPSQSLSRVAKRVAAGPTSPEDAKRAIEELDRAIKNFLTKNGKLPPDELAHNLQELLNSPAFEAHAFNLPRGLTVIEVDTGLQASDYLVMNTNTGTKVFSLPNLEVFDNAQLIIDQGAPNLVLIGHTGGQGSHKPRIKILSLLPDDVLDVSGKAGVSLVGEGSAAFAPDHKNINVDQSLYSIGVAQEAFRALGDTPNKEDENLHGKLTWNDAHYTLSLPAGKSPLAALYAVARLIQKQELPAEYKRYVSASVEKAIADDASMQEPSPQFVVSRSNEPSRRRRKRTSRTAYAMSNEKSTITIAVEPKGVAPDAYWVATEIAHEARSPESLATSKGAENPPGATNGANQQATGNQTSASNAQAPASTSTATATTGSTTVPGAATGTGTGTSAIPAAGPLLKDVNEPRKVPAKIVEKAITQHVEPGTQHSVQVATVNPEQAEAIKKHDKNATPADLEATRRAEKERLEKELAKTRAEREKAEKAVREKAEQERLAKERAEKEKAEKEKAAREKAEREKAERERAEREKASRHHAGGSSGSGSIRTPANVRSGPGGNYRPFTTLPGGASVDVLGVEGDWVHVRANGQTGYIYRSLVNIGSSSGSSSHHQESSSNSSTGSHSRHHNESHHDTSASQSSTSHSNKSSSSNKSNSSNKSSSGNKSSSSSKSSSSHKSSSHKTEAIPEFVP